MPAWHVGDRTIDTAKPFMRDLASRIVNPVQLTSDGHQPYVEAVYGAFGNKTNYSMLVKHVPTDGGKLSIMKNAVIGILPKTGVSTSMVERNNLTMRMSMRRFTRRTNGNSKRVFMHRHAVALHFHVLLQLQLREDPHRDRHDPGAGREGGQQQVEPGGSAGTG